MVDAINHTRSLIRDAAMVGFNPLDGTWADQLYESQGMTRKLVDRIPVSEGESEREPGDDYRLDTGRFWTHTASGKYTTMPNGENVWLEEGDSYQPTRLLVDRGANTLVCLGDFYDNGVQGQGVEMATLFLSALARKQRQDRFKQATE